MARITGAKIRLDRAAIDELGFDSAYRVTRNAAERTAQRARQNITRLNRIRTGRMRDSVTASWDQRTTRNPSFVVRAAAPYSSFQEYGVKGPVLPKRGKVLRFTPAGSSVAIYRPRTRGFPGAFFMRDAYLALSPRDFTA